MTLEEMNAKYGKPTTSSSGSNSSSSITSLWDEKPVMKDRNLLQKAAGFVLDPVTKLATETGNLAGKVIVRGVEQFQTPEQKVITEANLQKALNNPSQVPGLGTEVKGLNNVTARDVAGQALETGAMFAPGAGKGASLLTKAAVGAGTGYAFDVSQNLQNENKKLGQSFKPGISTVVGTALPIVGEGVKYVSKNLPGWFVKSTLPKLNENKIGVEETLNKLDYGSIDKNLTKSKTAISGMGKNIDTILQKPENSTKVIGQNVIDTTLSAFPDSNYTSDHIIKEVKELVPAKAKIVDKIINGTATPFEANQLKKEIYDKTAKVYENMGTPTARKEIGATFATTLADTIKSTVPETQPIFGDLSKEINLRTALIGASKKAQANSKLGMFDIAGYFAGGIPAIIGEKAVRSPGVQLSTAKAVNTLSKLKVIPKVGEGVKRATLKGLSTLNN